MGGHFTASMGCTVYYAESIEKVRKFTGKANHCTKCPRLYEKCMQE